MAFFTGHGARDPAPHSVSEVGSLASVATGPAFFCIALFYHDVGHQSRSSPLPDPYGSLQTCVARLESFLVTAIWQGLAWKPHTGGNPKPTVLTVLSDCYRRSREVNYRRDPDEVDASLLVEGHPKGQWTRRSCAEARERGPTRSRPAADSCRQRLGGPFVPVS